LATKKYVLIRVISQIKAINARPIPQALPGQKKDFPTAVAASHNASNSRRRVYHSATRKKQASSYKKNFAIGFRALFLACDVYFFYTECCRKIILLSERLVAMVSADAGFPCVTLCPPW
jgi:hypothetical protein